MFDAPLSKIAYILLNHLHFLLAIHFGLPFPLTLTFPAISSFLPTTPYSTATWILQHRPQISIVGVDVISLDYGPSIDYPAHTILLGANKPGIENVANLDKLAAELRAGNDNNNNVDTMAMGMVQAWPVVKAMKKVEITALPMKIGNGSGGPTRVMAVVTDDDDRLE